jgi:hypothetical protein
MRPRKHFIRTQKLGPTLEGVWAVFASTSLLSLFGAGHKLLAACRTLNTLKVDATLVFPEVKSCLVLKYDSALLWSKFG